MVLFFKSLWGKFSLFTPAGLFIILYFDYNRSICCLLLAWTEYPDHSLWWRVICLLMKGQWICLSTILLLNRLTETPSFMVICRFKLPCLFQGAYILLDYVSLCSFSVERRSKMLYNYQSKLTGNDKNNRKWPKGWVWNLNMWDVGGGALIPEDLLII